MEFSRSCKNISYVYTYVKRNTARLVFLILVVFHIEILFNQVFYDFGYFFILFFKIRCWQVNSMKTAWWDIKDIGKWNFMAEKGWCWIWYQVITTWIEIKVDPHTCLHMIQMKRNRRRVSVQLKLSALCWNKNLYKLSKLY